MITDYELKGTARTFYPPDGVLADGLGDELDSLTDRRILVDEDFEAVHLEDVDVLEGDDLLVRRKVQRSRPTDGRRSSGASSRNTQPDKTYWRSRWD